MSIQIVTRGYFYNMNNNIKSQIKSLTGLRFIMVMAIVFCHFEYFAYIYPINVVYPEYWNFQVLGVDFFFLLSGFGMMLSNLNKQPTLKLRPRVIDVNYGIQHVRRLYPLYIVITLLCIIPSLYFEPYFGLKYEIPKFILSISLLQSLTGMMYFAHAYNGVAWFLSSLFCIYLISPMMMFLMRKASKSLLSDIVLFCCSIIILVLLSQIFGVVQDYYAGKIFPKIDVLVYESPVRRAFFVSAGMALSLIYYRVNEKLKVFLSQPHIASYIEFSVVVGAFLYYIGRNKLHWGMWNIVVDILFASMFVFVFAFEKGFLSSMLSSRKMLLFGRMSMYIFLIHYPIRIYLGHIIENWGGYDLLTSSLFTIFVLLTTFLLSYILIIHSNSSDKKISL